MISLMLLTSSQKFPKKDVDLVAMERDMCANIVKKEWMKLGFTHMTVFFFQTRI